uniref:Uncharacterized protein n=1 Tax=Oryza glaberrima TaxID=4538 RepID=I1R4C9_ORYGL
MEDPTQNAPPQKHNIRTSLNIAENRFSEDITGTKNCATQLIPFCCSTNSAEIHNLFLEDEDIPPSLVMPSKQEQFCRCDFHGIDYLEDYYRYGKTCFETGQDHMAVETIKLMLATYTLVTELDDNLQYSTNFHAPQHKRLN